MMKILIILLALYSFNVSAEDVPKITAYDEALKLLDGFQNISVQVVLFGDVKQCHVNKKSMLGKELLALSSSKIRIVDDSRKADAILMVGIDSKALKNGYCLSNITLRLGSLASAYFKNADISKVAIVYLYEDDRLIYSKSIDNSSVIEKASGKLLDRFVFKWNYFNKNERK